MVVVMAVVVDLVVVVVVVVVEAAVIVVLVVEFVGLQTHWPIVAQRTNKRGGDGRRSVPAACHSPEPGGGCFSGSVKISGHLSGGLGGFFRFRWPCFVTSSVTSTFLYCFFATESEFNVYLDFTVEFL